jgi:hypothetical protein
MSTTRLVLLMIGSAIAGVPIRLALNGSVMSQWGKTGPDGKYAIAVPYGEYRVDGYELEPRQVDPLLGGKTDSPRNWGYHRAESFRVAEGVPGAGVELDYIDPVIVVAPKGAVLASQPIVLKWQPYPEATSYRLQLEEFRRAGDFQNERWLFDWSERPVVEGTTFDLDAKGVKLRPGYHYQVRVEALGASRRILSNTGNRFAVTDFHVTE